MTAEPTVTVTQYTVSLLPEDHPSAHSYLIKVKYASRGRWAASHLRYWLSADGTWSPGPSGDETREEWYDAHRFDLDTAWRLAREVAPTITVSGFTVADVLAKAER